MEHYTRTLETTMGQIIVDPFVKISVGEFKNLINKECSYETGARTAKREWRVCPRGCSAIQAASRTLLTATAVMSC